MKKKKGLNIALVIAILVLGVGGGIAFGYFRKSGKQVIPQETVKRGTISEVVTVTGKIKAATDLNLAFQRGGKVAGVLVKEGDMVHAGQSLVFLDSSELNAQLAEDEANLAAQKAKLDELKRGTRPEEIAIKQSELQKAKQDLANDYAGVSDVLNDAYVKSDDAIRAKTTKFFTNDDSNQPQLNFLTTDSQIKTDTENLRALVKSEMVTWQNEIKSVSVLSSGPILEAALQSVTGHLATASAFLAKLSSALDKAYGIPSATMDSYKADLNTARTNVNTALSAVNDKNQAIAAQKIVVATTASELNLDIAGTPVEQINAQDAAVRQAEAKVSQTQAQINQMTLASPIQGLITEQDAKLGEIVTANAPVITVISSNNLQIESNVPEIDIGRILVGNVVHIKIDAFPGETFEGKVIKIDSGETIVDGVVNFKVTVAFNAADPRFKSGLTSNLSIETTKKTDVLILPQFAILEKDAGAFVTKVEADGSTRDVEVQLGVRGEDGNVEIISGLNEGDTVLNIGFKENGAQ